MDYTKNASLWTSYNNVDLCAFFKSAFFRKYVDYCIKKYGLVEDQNLVYNIRRQLDVDMQALDLIPITALEDAYSEERELNELRKFAELYKF